jgi:hypothetical protein
LAAQPEWPKVTVGPYIELSRERQWYLDVQLTLSNGGTLNNYAPAPANVPFVFDGMVLVWPVVPDTGAARLQTNDIQSWLRFDGHEVESGPFAKESSPDAPRPVLVKTMTNGAQYPAGVWLGRWEWTRKATQISVMQLELNIPYLLYKTTLDDAAANNVGWPQGPWPEVASSCFQPQMFIDCGIDPVTAQLKMYDMKPIRDAVNSWTENKPKALPPLKLAKYLTFKVVQSITPGRIDYFYAQTYQQYFGLSLLGAPAAFTSGRIGNRDLGTVLVAVLREAGLPARLVYGYQARPIIYDGAAIRPLQQEERLRCWVEFCLYDEAKKTINWVPIDYQFMRYTSSQMQNLDLPWLYFGTLNYANEMIPVALQAFPPTTVVAYGYPAFWGWVMTPNIPVNIGQAVSFGAGATASMVSPAGAAPTR